MTETERAAREASAALNTLLLKANSLLFPEDIARLKSAIGIADKIASIDK